MPGTEKFVFEPLIAPARRPAHTVNWLFDDWLATADIKPTTKHHYREVCDAYIRPKLGALPLQDVSARLLEQLYASFVKEGHPSVADRVHRLLHRAFAVAVRWDLLDQNPCDRAQRPAYRAARKDVWTQEQARTFIDGTTDHWLGPLWMVAIATGCRIGELLALTWRNVDMARGTISVTKTGRYVDGEWVVGEPKTPAAYRTLALTSEALDALTHQRTWQSAQRDRLGDQWPGGDLVFTGQKSGKSIHESVPLHALKRECERLGLPTVTCHGLRHLHASLLLDENLPVTQVSQQLGHASPAVTMQVYGHAIGKRNRDAAEAVSRALSAKARGSTYLFVVHTGRRADRVYRPQSKPCYD